MINECRGGWHWKLKWRKEWFEWEREHVERFTSDLGQCSIQVVKQYIWT